MTVGAEINIIRKYEKYEKWERRGQMAAGKHILGKLNTKRVFGTAKVGDRGQIVIPKEARELFGIKPGDTLLILGEEDTGLIVSRPDVLSDIANQLFETVKKEEK